MRHRILLVSLISLGLSSVTVLSAAPASQNENRRDDSHRVYDRDHRDYHQWDDNENRAYRRYWQEQHRAYRDFSKLNRREQSHYWNWRHGHPDQR